jgi:hypothetical protein
MPAPRVTHPAAPEFHPEFGYLCPTPQFRRVLRVAAISAGVGACAAALAFFAFTPRAESDIAPLQNALTATEAPEASMASAPAAWGVGLAQPAWGIASKPCMQQAWPYIAKNCLSGAAEEGTSAPLRVLRPEQPAQSAPAQVMPAKTPEITAATPAETKAPAKKKPRTARRNRNRSRSPVEFDARDAYATQYRPRYEDPRRDWRW